MNATDRSTAGRIDLHRNAPAAIALLATGEQLAHEAALAAAHLAVVPDLRRMFARQAAQEARHLRIFRLAGQAWNLQPHSTVAGDAAEAWATSGIVRGITTARAECDLVALVVATQGVLEAVGASALALVEQHLSASPARWLLRGILREERAHQRIGERALGQLLVEAPRCAQRIAAALAEHVPAGAAMIETMGERLGLVVPAQSLLRTGFEDAIDAFREGIAFEHARLVSKGT